MDFENNIKKLSLTLPKAADPVGSYVAAKITGKMLFISGQISIDENGTLIKGKLGKDLDTDAGYLAAKRCGLSIISQAKKICGNDLSKIAGELDKLCILTAKKSEITEQLIEDNIGISKDFNNFELQNAIMNKDVFKANQIIKYFEANPRNNPIVVTLSVLYNLFSKVLIYHSLKDKNPQTVARSLGVNPYFVKDYQKAAQCYNLKKSVQALDALREADMKSKGYNNPSTPHSELMKELVFKLCHS